MTPATTRPWMTILVTAGIWLVDAFLIFILATLVFEKFDFARWRTTMEEVRRWVPPFSISGRVALAALIAAPLASGFFAIFALPHRGDPWRPYIRRAALLGVATGVLTVLGTSCFFLLGAGSASSTTSFGDLLVLGSQGTLLLGGSITLLFSPVLLPAGALFGIASASVAKCLHPAS